MMTLAIKKWNWIGFALVLVVLISGCNGGGSPSSVNGGFANALDVVFVANENSQTLMVIDLASGFTHTSTTGLTSISNDMQIRPDTNELWVLHSNPAEMRRYAIQTDKTQAPVFIDSKSLDIFSGNTYPENFAFSNHGKVFYVSSNGYSCISLRDANNDNDYKDLQVGIAPEGVTVLPNGNVAVAITAYLGPNGSGGLSYGSGEVVLCDSALNNILVRDTVGINPRVIRYYNNALYVVCSGDFNTNLGTLWKLDPNTLQPLTTTPIAFVGSYPGDLAIDVDSTGQAWGVLPAVSRLESDAQDIFIIDITNWIVHQTVQANGDPFRAVALPHGGVAISKKTSNQITIRLRDGTFYNYQAGDGPIAIVAASK